MIREVIIHQLVLYFVGGKFVDVQIYRPHGIALDKRYRRRRIALVERS